MKLWVDLLTTGYGLIAVAVIRISRGLACAIHRFNHHAAWLELESGAINGRLIDIIWGTRGQNSVALPIEVIKAAHDDGHLILLD
jgi:hypothetical protein